MEMIVLAGGFGTRLRSVVTDIPKPMAEVKGRPFLEYIIQYWIKEGIDKIIFSVGYKSEIIANHFGNSFDTVPLYYSVEDTPLGTGGCIMHALPFIQKETFVVVNGDTLFLTKLSNLLDFHQKTNSQLTLTLFSSENKRYGRIELDEQKHILSFNKSSFSPYANAGVYCINKQCIQSMDWKYGQKLSMEDELISKVISSGNIVKGLPTNDSFIDIGIPEDYFAAELFVNKYLNNDHESK